jgi:hypothetical protein
MGRMPSSSSSVYQGVLPDTLKHSGQQNILAGAHAPSNHAIGQDSLLQFGTQVEGWNLDGTLFHLEVFIQLDK